MSVLELGDETVAEVVVPISMDTFAVVAIAVLLAGFPFQRFY